MLGRGKALAAAPAARRCWHGCRCRGGSAARRRPASRAPAPCSPRRPPCAARPAAAADSRAACEASPYVESLTSKGYEVLYLTEPIDEVAVQNLQVGAGRRAPRPPGPAAARACAGAAWARGPEPSAAGGDCPTALLARPRLQEFCQPLSASLCCARRSLRACSWRTCRARTCSWTRAVRCRWCSSWWLERAPPAACREGLQLDERAARFLLVCCLWVAARALSCWRWPALAGPTAWPHEARRMAVLRRAAASPTGRAVLCQRGCCALA